MKNPSKQDNKTIKTYNSKYYYPYSVSNFTTKV